MLGCLRSCPQPPCSPEAVARRLGMSAGGDLDPVLCSTSLECPLPSSQTTRSNPKKTIWKDTETRVNDTLKESSSTLCCPSHSARHGKQARTPPFPISFWNVDSDSRISKSPQSPTTLSALQSDVSCQASGSYYPITRGEGGHCGPSLRSLPGLRVAGPCLVKGPSCCWLSFPVETFSQSPRPQDALGCGNLTVSGKMSFSPH